MNSLDGKDLSKRRKGYKKTQDFIILLSKLIWGLMLGER